MLGRLCAGLVGFAVILAACSIEQDEAEVYQRQLGPESPKIKVEGSRTYVFADGDPEWPGASGTQWFEFTDALVPASQLQYGIGKDRIVSIDDPHFVAPDDPRLLDIPPSPYREDEIATTNDEIMVVGYVDGGVAKAYPIALLDRHEVVNDEFVGKPVSVGW